LEVSTTISSKILKNRVVAWSHTVDGRLMPRDQDRAKSIVES